MAIKKISPLMNNKPVLNFFFSICFCPVPWNDKNSILQEEPVLWFQRCQRFQRFQRNVSIQPSVSSVSGMSDCLLRRTFPDISGRFLIEQKHGYLFTHLQCDVKIVSVVSARPQFIKRAPCRFSLLTSPLVKCRLA